MTPSEMIGLSLQERREIKLGAYAGTSTFDLSMLLDWLDEATELQYFEYARGWCIDRIDIYRGGIITGNAKDLMRRKWLKFEDALESRPYLGVTRRAEEIDLRPIDMLLLRRMVSAGASGMGSLMLVRWLEQSSEPNFRRYVPMWLEIWPDDLKWGLPALENAVRGILSESVWPAK